METTHQTEFGPPPQEKTRREEAEADHPSAGPGGNSRAPAGGVLDEGKAAKAPQIGHSAIATLAEFEIALARADEDDAWEQYRVALCYLSGRYFKDRAFFLAQDKDKAADFLRRAAGNGCEAASTLLTAPSSLDAASSWSSLLATLPKMPQESFAEAFFKEVRILVNAHPWGSRFLVFANIAFPKADAALRMAVAWLYGFDLVRLLAALALLACGLYFAVLTILDLFYLPLICGEIGEWYLIFQCESTKVHEYVYLGLTMIAAVLLAGAAKLFQTIGFVRRGYAWVATNETLRKCVPDRRKIRRLFTSEYWAQLYGRISARF